VRPTGWDVTLRHALAGVADGGGANWTLIAARGRSSYARDRLGAMLGLSPPVIERLAAPESSVEGGCVGS
jgi:hypothetical protein